MKAIIFDVDKTLIEWPKDHTKSVNKTLDLLNIKYDDSLPIKIYDTIDEFEENNIIFEKKKLIKYLNRKLNIKLPMQFIDLYIKKIGELVKSDDEKLEDTLNYLCRKYDLYVISNWFTESQILRLKKMGILKYFKKVYGGDINYLKPHPKTFDVILQNYKKEDCIYVGDKLKTDIEFAESIGIKPIWKTNEESDKYITIKKISDLRYIL